VYHYGSRVHPTLDARPETFEKLAQQFFETFPQLEGLRFTHAWGGAIDTCSRFFAFWGTALRDRVAYVLGYTGMGVAESRFGAEVCLDLLSGRETELTRLELVRSRPAPFPPEPLRSATIQLTRRSLARADAGGGHRDLWLRTLDRFGLGFDS
jgi:glycine/D-amino acid oxidase-like deaminating enzyme